MRRASSYPLSPGKSSAPVSSRRSARTSVIGSKTSLPSPDTATMGSSAKARERGADVARRAVAECKNARRFIVVPASRPNRMAAAGTLVRCVTSGKWPFATCTQTSIDRGRNSVTGLFHAGTEV
jgi:hypothetical protein